MASQHFIQALINAVGRDGDRYFSLLITLHTIL